MTKIRVSFLILIIMFYVSSGNYFDTLMIFNAISAVYVGLYLNPINNIDKLSTKLSILVMRILMLFVLFIIVSILPVYILTDGLIVIHGEKYTGKMTEVWVFMSISIYVYMIIFYGFMKQSFIELKRGGRSINTLIKGAILVR